MQAAASPCGHGQASSRTSRRAPRPAAGSGARRGVGPRRSAAPATLRRLDAHGFAWEDVAADVLPVFERARPFSYPVDPPALIVLPPGVTVGFGVDAGPAFVRIATPHLAAWPVDLAGLADQYSSNLSLTDRAEAKTVLSNQRDQLRERLRRSLRMAYGVMNPSREFWMNPYG